jgi:hypothetical protein
MDLLTGISSVKAASDLLTTILGKLGQPSIDFPEIQAKLLQLSSIILDGRQALIEIHEENSKLRQERDEALAKLVLRDDMEFCVDGGFYVRNSQKDKGLIPYCPVCWTESGKAVNMKLSVLKNGYTCVLHAGHKYSTQAQEEAERQRLDAERQHRPRTTAWS